MGRNRFFILAGEEPEVEVTRDQFAYAEQLCGFVPRIPGDVATAGFTHHGPDYDVEGRVEWDVDPAFDEEPV